MTPTHTRTPTPVDNLIDRHLDEYAALNPIVATASGIPGHEAELPDLSPDWLASVSALRQRTIAGLADAVPIDANDRVTVAAATDEFTVAEQIRATGADESRLNNVSSPVQDVRAVFDLMATSSADDWALIATRLTRVPDAINSCLRSSKAASWKICAGPALMRWRRCRSMVSPSADWASAKAKRSSTRSAVLRLHDCPPTGRVI